MARKIKIDLKIFTVKEIKTLAKRISKKIKIIFKKTILNGCINALIFTADKVKKTLADIKNKKWRGLIAILISVGIFFFWGLTSAVLWLIFLVFLVYGWKNSVIAVCALICLVSCPIFSAFNDTARTEQAIILAYFFLIITAILQLINYSVGQFLKDKNVW